mmetsp:Transcript_11996/g.22751  ORF Transcript_11996/g.22751 Transcript_11996/m.22751 type:complete len:231 (+) Transcript_11996:202-894(+)
MSARATHSLKEAPLTSLKLSVIFVVVVILVVETQMGALTVSTPHPRNSVIVFIKQVLPFTVDGPLAPVFVGAECGNLVAVFVQKPRRPSLFCLLQEIRAVVLCLEHAPPVGSLLRRAHVDALHVPAFLHGQLLHLAVRTYVGVLNKVNLSKEGTQHHRAPNFPIVFAVPAVEVTRFHVALRVTVAVTNVRDLAFRSAHVLVPALAFHTARGGLLSPGIRIAYHCQHQQSH